MDQRTTVGGVLALKEAVTQWWNADKIFGLGIERSGNGVFNENRSFGYDNSGRLAQERYLPFPEWISIWGSNDTANSFFDNNAVLGATGGIGVRTRTDRISDQARYGSGGLNIHEVPSVATFGRVTSETLRVLPRTIPMNGFALGAQSVSLKLDERPLPVNYVGWWDLEGDWSTTKSLAPGVHYIKRTATHPSGFTTNPVTTSFFYVDPHPETLTTGYDEVGNVATRASRPDPNSLGPRLPSCGISLRYVNRWANTFSRATTFGELVSGISSTACNNEPTRNRTDSPRSVGSK